MTFKWGSRPKRTPFRTGREWVVNYLWCLGCI